MDLELGSASKHSQWGVTSVIFRRTDRTFSSRQMSVYLGKMCMQPSLQLDLQYRHLLVLYRRCVCSGGLAPVRDFLVDNDSCPLSYAIGVEKTNVVSFSHAGKRGHDSSDTRNGRDKSSSSSSSRDSSNGVRANIGDFHSWPDIHNFANNAAQTHPGGKPKGQTVGALPAIELDGYIRIKTPCLRGFPSVGGSG